MILETFDKVVNRGGPDAPTYRSLWLLGVYQWDQMASLPATDTCGSPVVTDDRWRLLPRE